MTMSLPWILSACLLLAPELAPGPRPAPRAMFGLVVGSNRSADPDGIPLRYADDDAIQNALLLRQIGAEVILLADPDPQTRRLNPEIEPQPATLEALRAAFAELDRRMEQARSEGQAATLYLFLSGHGDVQNGEGTFVLENGVLGREELLAFLRQTRADRVHVVIDACKSYFLVFQRGPGGKRRPVQATLEEDSGELPDKIGVFLSTSAAEDSHEWEAFQGGVFGHELRHSDKP